MTTTRDELRAEADLNAPHGMVISTGEVLDLLDQLDQQERELDSWMTRAYEAEGKLWKAEADRDWNLRSSRLAKEERIQANARADQAEARIKAVQDVLDGHTKPTDRIGDLPGMIRRALDG